MRHNPFSLPVITPKTFRHSFAMHLIQCRVPLKVVQTYMGHKEASSTEVYTRVFALDVGHQYGVRFSMAADTAKRLISGGGGVPAIKFWPSRPVGKIASKYAPSGRHKGKECQQKGYHATPMHVKNASTKSGRKKTPMSDEVLFRCLFSSVVAGENRRVMRSSLRP